MFNFSDVYVKPIFMVLTFLAFIVLGIVLAIFYHMREKRLGITRNARPTKQIVLGALAIATSFALSFVRLFRMPYGGSITLASILPIALYCYAFGFNSSMLICFAFALLNFCQDPYVISPWSAIFDYILPYLSIAVIGLFTPNTNENTPSSIKGNRKFFIGLALYFLLRLFSHTVAGAWFWSEGVNFWIFQGDLYGINAVLYSLTYNALFLLPDTIIVGICAFAVLSSKTINMYLWKK